MELKKQIRIENTLGLLLVKLSVVGVCLSFSLLDLTLLVWDYFKDSEGIWYPNDLRTALAKQGL